MAVTAASLKARHPEFASQSDATVESYIAQAEAGHDATVWGDLYDSGVDFKACDLMARQPFGRKLRLDKKETETTYEKEWNRLRNQVGAAYRMLSC